MRRWLAALTVIMLLLTGCSGAGASVQVFAAASLAQPLDELAGEEASFSFGGSSGLVDQIAGGAPADVFISADEATMNRAVGQGLVGEPRKFLENHLVVVTPPDNPGGITGFDASLTGSRLVACADEVPCGAAAKKLADLNDLVLAPVSEESSVTDVLGKVTSGEADAGLVYVTDARGAGEAVATFEITGAREHLNTYWIAPVVDGDADAAETFIERVLNSSEVFAAHGFGIPYE